MFNKTIALLCCFHSCDGATTLLRNLKESSGSCFGSDCPLQVSFSLQLAGYTNTLSYGTSSSFYKDQQSAVRFAVAAFAGVPRSPTDLSTFGRPFHAVSLSNVAICRGTADDDQQGCVPGAAYKSVKFDVHIATANETAGDLLVHKLNPIQANQTTFLEELRSVLQSGDKALWPEFSASTVPDQFNVVMLSRASVTKAAVPTTSFPTPFPTPFPTWQNYDDDGDTGNAVVFMVLSAFGWLLAVVFMVLFCIVKCRVTRLRRQLQSTTKISAALTLANPSSACAPMGRPVSANTAAAFVMGESRNLRGNNVLMNTLFGTPSSTPTILNTAAQTLPHGAAGVETAYGNQPYVAMNSDPGTSISVATL